jgi:hypothetical protein
MDTLAGSRPRLTEVGKVLPILAAVFLAVGSAVPGASQEFPAPHAFSLAMTRLDLGLALEFSDGSLSGWARYRIVNAGDEPVRDVPFNLGRLMRVREVRVVGPQGIVTALDFSQGIEAFSDSPKRQVDHVVVRLAEPLQPGDSATLRLDYGGFLVGYTETGSLYIQDRVDEQFSILREDAFAWPSLGTLSLSTNRVAPRPGFDFRAEITVPSGHTVASGGRLVERIEDGPRTTFVYESAAPVPFLNIPVAVYGLMEEGGVRVYHFPEDSVGARRVLDHATRGLALLERWFGPLGSEPDLAVMEIPEMWGSQASLTGGIIQTAEAFRDTERTSQLYHELTHLWNAPDLDQPSARWNEGLATFLSLRMAEELDGWEGMDADVERTAARLVSAADRTPAISEVPFLRYGEEGVTGLSYRVGHLMFYALHRALGDRTFDAALGGYYQEHRQIGGTFQDLMEAVQVSSPIDLDEFFRDWVHTTTWYQELLAGRHPAEIGVG